MYTSFEGILLNLDYIHILNVSMDVLIINLGQFDCRIDKIGYISKIGYTNDPVLTSNFI